MYFSKNYLYVAIPQASNSKFTPKRANKSSLADALWNHMPDNTPKLTFNIIILDRGTLPHRVFLCKGSAYEETCKHQVKCFNNHYGTAIVVLM